MAVNKKNNDFEKPDVDEEYLMNVISGDESVPQSDTIEHPAQKESKPGGRNRKNSAKKVDYEDTFLVNRFPSGRNGKVVYIRPEYHERLLRIVQLTREERITLYSYIDNILEHHFEEFGEDIKDYFDKHFKPIL